MEHSIALRDNVSGPDRTRLFALGGLLSGLTLALCQPCYGDTLMRHFPAHPLANEEIDFAAKAVGNIDRIDIIVDHAQLSIAADGSLLRTPVQSNIQVESCIVPTPHEILWCFGSLEAGFPDGSLITARAVAGGPDGTADTEVYQFAAGAYPFASDPIPLRVTGSSDERLDIVFVPAEDVEIDTLRRNLSSLINDQYFSYEAFRGVPGYPYRRVYNFFYTPEKGNYEHIEGEKRCEFTRPRNFSVLARFADTVAILHEAELRDCRQGILMSSEVSGGKSLFHESGHALFGLLDEYCCDSYYAELDFAPNIWRSSEACEVDAVNIGYSPSMCARIGSPFRTIPFWRVDPTIEPGSLMGSAKSLPSSTFLNASMRRILWRYRQCLTEKKCTPEALSFSTSGPEPLSSEFTLESTEESLEDTGQQQDTGQQRKLVELQQALGEQLRSIGEGAIGWEPSARTSMEDSSDVTLEVQLADDSGRILDAQQGTAVPSATLSPSELGVAVIDQQGKTVYTTNIADPRWVELEGEEWQLIDNIPVTITLPQMEDASELVIAPISQISGDKGGFVDWYKGAVGKTITYSSTNTKPGIDDFLKSLDGISSSEPGEVWRIQLGDLLEPQ